MVTSTDALRRTLERCKEEREFRIKHKMRVPAWLDAEIKRLEEQLTPPKARESALPLSLRAGAMNWWLLGAAVLLVAAGTIFFI